MKKIIMAAIIGLAAGAAFAADGYVSKTASGTTNAEILCNSGSQQARAVLVDATSDLSSSVITFQSGGASYTLATANTNTAATNLIVADCTGLASNDVVLLESAAGALTKATVWGTSNSTNVMVTAALGVAVTSGEPLYKLTNTVTTPVGAATLRLSGAAVFVADQGRPFLIKVNGTSACALNQVIINYGR